VQAQTSRYAEQFDVQSTHSTMMAGVGFGRRTMS